MTTNSDMQRLAEGTLRLAMKRLAHEYPFHVAILERFTVVPRPAVGTMAVAISGDWQRGAGRGTLDDHSVWEEFAGDPARSKAAIRSVVQDAVFEVGHDAVPEELTDALVEMGIGNKPGAGQQELHSGRRGRVDWRRLLRRHVGQVLEVRPVFNRPPRRFPELVGIIPGKRRQSGRPKVMAVIDTSDSITPDLLELIDAELARLAKHYTVVVVVCDAAIHAVFAYRRLDAVHGRGGTDLRPPFEQDFLRKHRPDLLIYFTDGFGPAPARSPRLPAIWCLVPGGEVPVDWGKKIHMDGGESAG